MNTLARDHFWYNSSADEMLLKWYVSWLYPADVCSEMKVGVWWVWREHADVIGKMTNQQKQTQRINTL